MPDQHQSDTHQVLPTPGNAAIPRSSDTICKETPVFFVESGTPLTARALGLVLHHLICRCGDSTKLYNTHSLRIGATKAAARSGLPPATIKNLDKWRSEAYKVYTRHPLTQPYDSHSLSSVTFMHSHWHMHACCICIPMPGTINPLKPYCGYIVTL